MTTPQRRKFTRDEREKIIGFYGHNCVITGNSNIDLDHLVDKPCRNEIADAAPVAKTLNRSRGGYKPLVKSVSNMDGLPAPLYPGFLDRTAALHYSLWREPAAYACARLALTMKLRYRPHEDPSRIDLLCSVMRYARQLQRQDLIGTVLEEDVPRALAGTKVTDRGPVAYELACLWNEYGHQRLAGDLLEAWNRHIMEWLRHISCERRDNFKRRQRLINVEKAQPGERAANLKAATARDGSLWLYVNHLLPVVWDGVQREDYRQVVDYLDPLVKVLKVRLTTHPLGSQEIRGTAVKPNELAIPGVNKSNAAEVLLDWAMGRAAMSKPRRVPREAEWAVVLGTRIYQSTGMRLANVRDGYVPPHARLLARLSRFGGCRRVK